MWRWLVLAAVCSCVETHTVTCPGGLTCPADSLCVFVGGLPACASDADQAACTGHSDGFACDTSSERKACHDGVCIDTCGDHRIQTYETCDDGNQVPGDNCSARCLIEGCGNGDVDRVLGEECDDGVAGISGDGCSSTCRIEQPMWTQLVQTDKPTPRAGHAMATLPASANRRAQLVQFGGIGADGTLDESWVWDGALLSPLWSQAFPARSPSARLGHAMAYVGNRDRVMLFGGYAPAGFLDDTWEWDGQVWTNVSPASSPGPRTDMALAYDPVRQVTVMYGGANALGIQRDTWQWNGTAWTNLTTVTPPPANSFVQLAYNVAGSQMIYCGGPETPATWKFDGSWTNLNVACPFTNGKPNRLGYDPRRNTLLLVQAEGNVFKWTGSAWAADGAVGTNALYGTAFADDGVNMVTFGGSYDGRYFDASNLQKQTYRRNATDVNFAFYIATPFDVQTRARGDVAFDSRRMRGIVHGGIVPSFANTTWTYDFRRWQIVEYPALFPAPYRYDGAATYDPDRDVVVLFGGVGSQSLMAPPLTLLDDTWEMTPDLKWAQRTPATKPSKRFGVALAYDAARKQTIMFGGDADASQANGQQLAETWLWDGTTWTMLTPASSPPARSHAAMAYDPDRHVLVLFGGKSGKAGYLNDTWEWDGTTWTQGATAQSSTELPFPRAQSSMVYDPLRHRIVLLGGGAVAYDGSHASDVWEWDGTRWTFTFDDPRLARIGAHAFFDPLYGGIVLYGGEVSNSVGNTAQTWLLRWESLQSRETCRFADDVDRDGDGLRGCEDPDCGPRCSACGNNTCDAFEDRLICDHDCD